MQPARRLLQFFFLAAFFARAVHAADGMSSSTADRLRLARQIFSHDFENRRNAETGLPSLLSADLDVNGWPDFWEPVRAVGFPEYLVSGIAIVRDESPFVIGAYRDMDNHVLHMSFDGSRVGIRTSVPIPIDPNLAYEFSIRARDSAIEGAVIRSGVEWLRIDSASTESLRRDEVPDFTPGQADWPVVPHAALISEPPAEANAARLFVILEGDQRLPRLARHGSIWLDDIRLRQIPNIRVEAKPAESGPFRVAVTYSGLTDNIPDPESPGYFRGRRYSRRVEVTDIQGRPLPLPAPGYLALSPEAAAAQEDIVFPGDRYGVYYLNLRLYDADDRLATDMTRAVAVLRQGRTGSSFGLRSGKPLFGVSAGAPPASILDERGAFENIVSGIGARQVKITPWLDRLSSEDEGIGYFDLLAEEIRRIRSGGVMTAGVIDPPSGSFGDDSLAEAAVDKAERLEQLIRTAGRRLGLYMDGWQWGGDADSSLADEKIPAPALSGLVDVLGEFSGGMPMAWNLRMDREQGGGTPAPENFGVVDMFVPSGVPSTRIWQGLAAVFPWLYAPFHQERGEIYPPGELTALAPPPPADQLDAAARERERREAWMTIEAEKAGVMEPNIFSERKQLEELMVKAIRSAALAPETLYLGDLFDPERGHLRMGMQSRGFSLATFARPSYLAVRTLVDLLESAEYLGPLRLLEPFEAQVFRRTGTDDAVIALWHNGPDGEKRLDQSEIAKGPALSLIDWAGNRSPLPASIPVSRTPSFITGLPASLLLTRMSVRIAPEPPVRSTNRRQPQHLEVANHTATQAPLRFQLRYAARAGDGGMENGWTNTPADLSANLPPMSSPPRSTIVRYAVSPDPNSPIQGFFQGTADKSGSKLVQVRMDVNSNVPATMIMYLGFNLRSEIDVDVRELPRMDDPNFCTLQLRIRWFPETGTRRQGSISLRPFYLKRGEMRETAPQAATVSASPAESRGDPALGYETIELRIPRQPARQTWVGLAEEGGGGFYLADVTELINAGSR